MGVGFIPTTEQEADRL